MPTQVTDRADRAIARLGAMHGNVAVFSHGHFSCELAARWIGLPIIEARHFSLNPAALRRRPGMNESPEVFWRDNSEGEIPARRSAA
jgi:probable phosphoglycerate mutase